MYAARLSLLLLATTAHAAPIVKFSADERSVTITNQRQAVDTRGGHTFTTVTRTIPRPTTPAWNFLPRGGVARWTSPTGNDANPGTSEQPYRTMAKLLASGQPGDVLYVRAGTYTEALPNITGLATTADKPMVLTCAPGALGQVVIARPAADVKTAPWRSVLTVSAVNHVTINGLVLQGAMGMPGADAVSADRSGVYLTNGAGTGIRLTNNVIHSCQHCGVKEAGHGGKGFVIEGNVLLNNGSATTDHGVYISSQDSTGVVVSGNIVLDNWGAGIHLYGSRGGPDGVSATRNVAAGNTDQILVSGARCEVRNNTCLGGYAGLRLYNAGCHNNVISGNVFAFSSAYDVVRDNAGPNNATDANCYWGSQAGFGGGFVPSGLSVKADPKIVDLAGGDWRCGEARCAGMGAWGR